MDRAGEELGRIVAFVRRRPWIMEEPVVCCGGAGMSSPSSVGDNTDEQRSNYFLDRLGATKEGDTSLHRICAWHATPEQFDNFLEHMECHSQYLMECHALGIPTVASKRQNTDSLFSSCANGVCQCKDDDYSTLPPPPRIGQTNHQGVTALHVAVFRNSFHAFPIVQKLLKLQPSMASTPMTTCGSYPLHILCGHSATIRKDILKAVLTADPFVVWKEDCNGDTPLSLLWKNVLRFRWAQEDHIVLQTQEEIDAELDLIDDRDNFNHSPRRPHRALRQSWMTMISPQEYVEYSLMMIRAALQKSELKLVDICRMPRCPPMLVQLILSQLAEGKAHNALVGTVSPDWRAVDDLSGQTPLHAAASALGKSMTTKFVPPKGQERMVSLVDLLLDADPSSATKVDTSGRLALHHALEMNDYQLSTETAMRFVKANPSSLQGQDPVTGLYPIALLAAEEEHQAQPLSNQRPSAVVSTQNTDTIFAMLRYSPEVATYCR